MNVNLKDYGKEWRIKLTVINSDPDEHSVSPLAVGICNFLKQTGPVFSSLCFKQQCDCAFYAVA